MATVTVNDPAGTPPPPPDAPFELITIPEGQYYAATGKGEPKQGGSNPAAPAAPASADPWAQYAAPPADDQSKSPAAGSKTDPWAAYAAPPPDSTPAPSAPKPVIGGEEAGVRGGLDALTFGTAPAIAGVAEASGIPSAAKNPGEIDINPIRPLVGAYKMLDDWIAGHKDPDVMAAYNRGRQDFLAQQNAAQEQHPYAYVAGQLGAAMAVPLGAAARATTAVGRVAKTALTGGLQNAAWDSGTDLSEGNIQNIPKDAGKGFLTGAAFGTAGAGAAELAGKATGKITSLIRGKNDVDAEAGSRVVGALAKDFEANAAPLTPAELAAGKRAGTPMYIADAGGENTRALLRSSANTSPSGRQVLKETLGGRFKDQSRRLGQRIRGMIGGGNTADDLDYLNSMARKANKPAYQRAYAAGSNGMWSPELERLTTSEALPKAMQAAVERGRNRAVLDGMGGFNPRVRFENGIMKFDKSAKGVMSYPDMQFWDYAQRELRDMANKAKRSGASEEAGALFGLHKQLLNELDKQNPAFKAARGQAASFFKAGNALEAGENFVREDINLDHAAKVLAKMSAPERELFRRGFAAELADQIEKISDKRNVLGSIFLNNGPARRKILMAMGPQDAKELEALLRVETLVDEARLALGNSTTIQQGIEMGAAGTAVGTIEAVKEGDFNPYHIVLGGLLYGGTHKFAKKIDENVAGRVAQMLMSQDPAVLARGYKIVANNPLFFDALRNATAAGARVGAHDVGPARAAAAALTGAHNLVHAGEAITGHHEHSGTNNNSSIDDAQDQSVIPH